jgi:hypothetical protein
MTPPAFEEGVSELAEGAPTRTIVLAGPLKTQVIAENSAGLMGGVVVNHKMAVAE